MGTCRCYTTYITTKLNFLWSLCLESSGYVQCSWNRNLIHTVQFDSYDLMRFFTVLIQTTHCIEMELVSLLNHAYCMRITGITLHIAFVRYTSQLGRAQPSFEKSLFFLFCIFSLRKEKERPILPVSSLPPIFNSWKNPKERFCLFLFFFDCICWYYN